MRALLLASLLFAACGTPSDPPPPTQACDTSAALSLSVTVTDAAGNMIPDATARWTAAARSDDCQRSGAELHCGWEVPGEMSVEIAAPGFVTKTVQVTIPQDECHVVQQRATVVLERTPWFAEDRSYVHKFFPTQEACTEALNGGRGMNCCATARFGTDGQAFLVVTDIMNGGAYRLETDAIVFTRETPGDVPEQIRFTIGAGDVLTDDAQGLTWTRAPSTGCY